MATVWPVGHFTETAPGSLRGALQEIWIQLLHRGGEGIAQTFRVGVGDVQMGSNA